jgi:hypothetical protein
MIELIAIQIALFLLRLSRFINWLGVESFFFEDMADKIYYYYKGK